jgi:hypothetical protein
MRLKRKVDINYREETHEWELSGLGWTRFIDESRYINIRTLHFIKEGADTFYVTAYEEDGGESGGYASLHTRHRMVRCTGLVGEDENISPIIIFNTPYLTNTIVHSSNLHIIT